jgi:hypothetical protein
MSEKVTVVAAGNTLAPALAVLHRLGFQVSAMNSSMSGPPLLQAEDETCRLIAEDPLLLLGLATLVRQRGANWKPTDEEVTDLLRLMGDDAA